MNTPRGLKQLFEIKTASELQGPIGVELYEISVLNAVGGRWPGLKNAPVSTWTVQCVHFTHSDPARGNRTLKSGMLPSRSNAAIVCKATNIQLEDVPLDTALSSPIEITRPTAHIFILLHGLTVKSQIPGSRIDIFLSKWAAERRVEAQIREFLNYRSKGMGQ